MNMMTEMQEYEEAIEAFIRYCLSISQLSETLTPNFDFDEIKYKRLSISDIEMSIARNKLLNDVEGKEYEKEMEGVKLLDAAAKNNHARVLSILESHPDLLWYRDRSNRETVFHVAARGGHRKIIEELIHIINVQAKTPKTSIWKFLNLRKCLRDIAWLLADNTSGYSPWLLAYRQCHKEVASILLRAMPPEMAYATKYSKIAPVKEAIASRDKDLVEEIIHRAPWQSLSQSTRHIILSSSLVHMSIKRRDMGIIKLILDNMPSLIDSPNLYGEKPLSYAASKGFFEGFCYMLNNFPNQAFIRDNNGSYPIHRASEKGHLNIVKEILLHQPEFANYPNTKGKRLLSIAASKGHVDIVLYMLKNYPDYAFKCDEDGRFPICNAVRTGHLNIAKEFLSLCPETINHLNKGGQQLFIDAVIASNIDLISWFLDNYPDFASEPNNQGSFPIHEAVAFNCVGVVKELLNKVPQTMYQIDAKGRSILHVVVEYERVDILSYLRGIPEIKKVFHFRDENGNTFADLVKRRMTKRVFVQKLSSPEKPSKKTFRRCNKKVIKKLVSGGCMLRCRC